MRAYTIVLFIIAVHVCLAMFGNVDFNVTNITIDTTQKGTFLITQGHVPYNYLPSSTLFFNMSNETKVNSSTMLTENDFVGKYIESIYGVGDVFSKFMNMFTSAVFSIHTLCAPWFGEFNSWAIEIMVDFVLAIGFFQVITGRSFKTME